MFSVLVSRLRILVVPASMVRILFSLVMPAMRFCMPSATIVRTTRTVMLSEDWFDEKQKCDNQPRERSQSHNVSSSVSLKRRAESLANTALPALFRAMPTISAILAGVTRVGPSASGREYVKRDLIDEKNRQHDLSQGRQQLRAHELVLLFLFFV